MAPDKAKARVVSRTQIVAQPDPPQAGLPPCFGKRKTLRVTASRSMVEVDTRWHGFGGAPWFNLSQAPTYYLPVQLIRVLPQVECRDSREMLGQYCVRVVAQDHGQSGLFIFRQNRVRLGITLDRSAVHLGTL
ncbi:hypothetical protein GGTG_14286 [Gaeumannomyces tritici R3-111a-1]|uniref:Uncharacterized protein n=1 Tax=Gaeumannomyces tritici (strain R3-111a-1) TaxID=644352 RepID=J3PL42_GAET3|nr:hypothetical protein GGTG_14286 [Gaeumannomyces tritici R3-111a-1]EJT68135.1 hypothetical protein GGTG_14286 [Gaeumannomyces tritici R3-111a-1]